MALFGNQFLSVIEWQEFRDDVIFWKWAQTEIKKNSRLIVKPGQDAIFLHNGKIEGIFRDEGNYQIETQIIPLLSTLKGFKFGFNSGLRAEVLFVNSKEFTVKWGTKSAINIPSPQLPGGLPIRAFGTFSVKVSDYITLIDKIAGIKNIYTVDDVRERLMAIMDQSLMKWIVREGRDMYNLMANSTEIASGIQKDVDMEMTTLGFSITSLKIASITYPPEVQERINKAASLNMINDVDKYQKINLADSLLTPGSHTAPFAGMAAGMAMAGQMASPSPATNPPPVGQGLQCSYCHAGIAANSKFCPSCGKKIEAEKFCTNCGAKQNAGAKFCNQCGNQIV